MKTMQKQVIVLTVNGRQHEFTVGREPYDMPPSETLIHTLRDRLGLTAAKLGCDEGACGACTVIIDGVAVPSCSVLTVECEDKSITTLEGLENPRHRRARPASAGVSGQHRLPVRLLLAWRYHGCQGAAHEKS